MITVPQGSRTTRDALREHLAGEIAQLFPDPLDCSEAEYLAADTNLLIEYSEGKIQVLPVPTDQHQAIVAFLFEALLLFVRPAKLGTVRFAALKVRLREGKYREPDVMFIKSQNDSRRKNEFWLWADLVMEVVSDENRSHDLTTKRQEYATAGIPEYWIVDPMLKQITVLQLIGKEYSQAGLYRLGDDAVSALLSGFSVNVAAVFDAK